MKVEIDRARCAGHARCNSVAPELYELDDEGYIEDRNLDVALEQEGRAHRGARACPERAIRTIGYTGGQDWPPAAK